MRRIVLLLALAALMAAVLASSAVPAGAQSMDMGMNCGWWWDWSNGVWYWACY
jgi:hypothetical protein